MSEYDGERRILPKVLWMPINIKDQFNKIEHEIEKAKQNKESDYNNLYIKHFEDLKEDALSFMTSRGMKPKRPKITQRISLTDTRKEMWHRRTVVLDMKHHGEWIATKEECYPSTVNELIAEAVDRISEEIPSRNCGNPISVTDCTLVSYNTEEIGARECWDCGSKNYEEKNNEG